MLNSWEVIFVVPYTSRGQNGAPFIVLAQRGTRQQFSSLRPPLAILANLWKSTALLKGHSRKCLESAIARPTSTTEMYTSNTTRSKHVYNNFTNIKMNSRVFLHKIYPMNGTTYRYMVRPEKIESKIQQYKSTTIN